MLEYKYVCHGAAFSYLPLRCVLWLSENFGTISRIALRKSKKKDEDQRKKTVFLFPPASSMTSGMTGAQPPTKARVK